MDSLSKLYGERTSSALRTIKNNCHVLLAHVAWLHKIILVSRFVTFTIEVGSYRLANARLGRDFRNYELRAAAEQRTRSHGDGVRVGVAGVRGSCVTCRRERMYVQYVRQSVRSLL